MHLVEGFRHEKGDHCESSAMRDLFEYNGYQMSEALVFGLDATMGFGFFDTTSSISFIPKSTIPFFLGGKNGTIESDSLACRLLGLIIKKQTFTSSDKAWIEAKNKIDQNLPLILMVDLGYLPYFKLEEEIHFGGHAITLAGYDDEKMVSYVGDTDFEGFQEVPIEILKRARSSEFGSKFMWPQNAQFSIFKRPDGKRPPLAAGIKLSIKKVVDNMLRPSISNIGIQGLKLFSRTIPEWKEKLIGNHRDASGNEISIARMMFELMHGYIETWGTGGALFRNLYRRFIEELSNLPELKEGARAWNSEEFSIIEETVPILRDSAKEWSHFAEILKISVDKYKDSCLEHVDLEYLHEISLSIVNKEEEIFTKLSKIKV